METYPPVAADLIEQFESQRKRDVVTLNFRYASRRLTVESDYDNIMAGPHTYGPDSRLLLNSLNYSFIASNHPGLIAQSTMLSPNTSNQITRFKHFLI